MLVLRIQHWLVVTLLGSSAVASAEPLTDAILHALEQGPTMQAAIESRYKEEAQIRQAYADYLPQLRSQVRVGFEHAENEEIARYHGDSSRTLRRVDRELSIRQMLWDGYAARAHVEQELFETHAAARKVHWVAESVTYDTIAAYLDVLLKKELSDIFEDNVSFFTQLKRAQDHGLHAHHDSIDKHELTLALEKAERAFLNATRAFEQARLQYKSMVGHFPDISSMPIPALPTHALPENEGRFIGVVLTEHPLLNAANAEFGASRALEAQAKSFRYPRVELELTTEAHTNADGYAGTSTSQRAAVNMNYDIFTGGRDQARVSEARHERERTLHSRNDVRRDVEATARDAWLHYELFQEHRPLILSTRDNALATRDAYRHAHQVGSRGLGDLITAQQRYLDAQVAAESAPFEEQLAYYDVMRSMGRLLTSLNLPLPPGSRFSTDDVSVWDNFRLDK